MFIIVHVLKMDGEVLPKVINSDHIHSVMPVYTHNAKALIKLSPDDTREVPQMERPIFVQESFEELCTVLCAQPVLGLATAPAPRRSRRKSA